MSTRIRFGLKTQFLLPTITLFILALGTATYSSYHESRQALQAAMQEQLTRMIDSITMTLSLLVDRTKLDVHFWSTQAIFLDAIPDTFLGKAAPVTSRPGFW